MFYMRGQSFGSGSAASILYRNQLFVIWVVLVLAAVHLAIISHEYWLGVRRCFTLKGASLNR